MRSVRLLALSVAIVVALPMHAVAQSAAPSASPAAAAVATGPFLPTLGADGKPEKRVFVFATSGDAPTRAKFAAVLTRRLQKNYILGRTRLLAEPDWGVADYVNACQNYSQYTAGALIVQIGEISNTVRSYFIGRANTTEIHANMIYVACTEASPTPAPTPIPVPTPTATAYTGGVITTTVPGIVSVVNWVPAASKTSPPLYSLTWQSDEEHEIGRPVKFWTPLPPLAFLMTLVSGYTALAPSRTTSSTMTTAFATPPPWVIPPRQGFVTTRADVAQTVTNASQLNAVASGLLTQSLAYSSSVEQIPTTDKQTLNAVNAVLDQLLVDLDCPKGPNQKPERESNAGGSFLATMTPAMTPTPTPTPLPKPAFGKCLIYS
jgi:hypothetical protein